MAHQKVNYSYYCKIIYVLVFILLFQPNYAQEQDSLQTSEASFFEVFKDDVKIAAGGIKAVYLKPLDWQTKDFLVAGAVGVGTGILYTIDEESSDFFVHQQEDIPKMFLDMGSYGSPEAIFALNGAVYLSGLVLKNEKVRRTGLLLVTSAAASGLFLSVSKVMIGRARPFTGEGKKEFRIFSFNDDHYRSFPSGHSLFAFSTAYAIGKQFDNPFLKAGISSLGLIGPASRLWEGEHWLTDVVVSMVLGVAVVETVDQYLKNEQPTLHATQKKISWSLNFGPTAFGITGTF